MARWMKGLNKAQIKPLRSGTSACSHETGPFGKENHAAACSSAETAVGKAVTLQLEGGVLDAAPDLMRTRRRHSSSSHFPTQPPITPPRMGATQNNQTWLKASPPA